MWAKLQNSKLPLQLNVITSYFNKAQVMCDCEYSQNSSILYIVLAIRISYIYNYI